MQQLYIYVHVIQLSEQRDVPKLHGIWNISNCYI